MGIANKKCGESDRDVVSYIKPPGGKIRCFIKIGGRGFESHLVREFFIHYYTIDMLYVRLNTWYTHVSTQTSSVITLSDDCRMKSLLRTRTYKIEFGDEQIVGH